MISPVRKRRYHPPGAPVDAPSTAARAAAPPGASRRDRPAARRAWLAPLLAAAAVAAGGCAAVRVPAAPPLRDPATGMSLVLVSGGCFQMGDLLGEGYPEELPVHEVCLADFYIGQFEVTQGQWRAVMGTRPSRDPACTADDCPVESVSWDEAQEFARRLGAASGATYRLPTEAEWEYAARSGGRRERYAGGDDVDRVAWYGESAGGGNHPVGGKAPNGLGLHDMSGNVWEWTSDWYADDYYAASPRENPQGPPGPAAPDVDHVIRGGCRTGEAHNERTARRSYGYQRASSDRSPKIGFRLVRVPGRREP